MTRTTKTLIAASALFALANCSGTADVSNLPVRDGPQTQLPYTYVSPVIVATDA